MDRNFPQWLPPYAVSHLLDPDQCAAIIAHAEQSGKFAAAQVGRQNGDVGVEEEYCVAQMAMFQRGELPYDIVDDTFRYIPTSLDKLNERYLFDLFPMRNVHKRQRMSCVSVMRYDAKDGGKFHPHIDVAGLPGADCRKLTVVVPLNDPASYEGGRLIIDTGERFDAFDGIVPGQAVTLCSMTMHGVTPVTQGTRYSLVFFLRGPHFR